MIILFKSPSVNSPGGNTQSLRKVPELIIVQSALTLAFTISLMKFPSFDSSDLTVKKRPSNSVSILPNTLLKFSFFKSSRETNHYYYCTTYNNNN